MDKREKVIKGLEKLIDTAGCVAVDDADCKSCPYISVNGCIDQIHQDALELLKAQEPVKPIIVNGEYECGFCRNEINPDTHTFCSCCGRSVKWE